MNKIDEIALRVAETKYSQLPEECMDFLHDVLAELSKDAVPFGYVYLEVVEAFDRVDCGTIYAKQGDGNRIPLFTHPAPVIASEQKPVAYFYVHNVTGESVFSRLNDDECAELGWSKEPLFTSPPNTAEIEQRVAEACARCVEPPVGLEDCDLLGGAEGRQLIEGTAEAIRAGEWRKFL